MRVAPRLETQLIELITELIARKEDEWSGYGNTLFRVCFISRSEQRDDERCRYGCSRMRVTDAGSTTLQTSGTRTQTAPLCVVVQACRRHLVRTPG